MGSTSPWLPSMVMRALGFCARKAGRSSGAMAPAAWVLIEWLRGWAFTGFPWMAFGYSQIDTWLGGWAPVAGVYGASFAMLLSAVAILVAIMTTAVQRWIALGLVFAPWILGVVFSTVHWTENDGPTIRATLIQAGISQDRKWLPEQREPTLMFYRYFRGRVRMLVLKMEQEAMIMVEIMHGQRRHPDDGDD